MLYVQETTRHPTFICNSQHSDYAAAIIYKEFSQLLRLTVGWYAMKKNTLCFQLPFFSKKPGSINFLLDILKVSAVLVCFRNFTKKILFASGPKCLLKFS